MKISICRSALMGALVAAAVSVAGCGGGGGSNVVDTAGTPNSTPSSSPIPAATACTAPAKNGSAAVVAGAADAVTVGAFTPATAQHNSKSTVGTAALPRSLRPTAAWIDLGMPAVKKTTSAASAKTNAAGERRGMPLQLGFARELLAAKTTDATRQLLQWTPASAGGAVAALRIQSIGAKGLRIGLQVNRLPAKAIVRFYAPNAAAETVLSGQEILDTLARNLAAGDTGEQARTYWGPFAGGAQGVVEIELPAGVDPATADVAVPAISHFTLDPGSKDVLLAEQKAIGSAGSCNKDIACSNPLPSVSNAIALMQFTRDGASFLCTGTLVNDADSSGVPYFLTANHCVGDQTTASTIETTWFYRASACNITTASPAAMTVTGGATLLYTVVAESNPANPVSTDTTFLRLNQPAPAGVMYAGWTSVPQKLSGLDYVGVHHPAGDLQKISRGQINSFAYIDSATTASVNPSGTNLPMYSVVWNSGVTEFGSSGSSLFLDGLSANPKIVGQLEGGAASCSNPSGRDFYGRFDIAYNTALKKWLNPNGKLCN